MIQIANYNVGLLERKRVLELLPLKRLDTLRIAAISIGENADFFHKMFPISIYAGNIGIFISICTFLPKVLMVVILLSRSPDLCSTNLIRLLFYYLCKKWHN